MKVWELVDRLHFLKRILEKEKNPTASAKVQKEYFEAVKELDQQRLENYYKLKDNEKSFR